MRGPAAVLASLCLSLTAPVAHAEPVRVDRAVVRFTAPELGGARSPRFVLGRQLAFEARLEALSDSERAGVYRERHLSAALERHVAETLLAGLRIDPSPRRASSRSRLKRLGA
jgi:hypothetical protein